MKVLVCGGAGYIGSHTVLELLNQGFEVVVLDNLETGHREAVPKDVQLLIGDLRDQQFISKVFKEHTIDGVIDFAAYSIVGESVSNPLKYYRNNVFGTINLLEEMVRNNVMNIVFSSTAAVYGEPEKVPITEEMPKSPKNPYGDSKLVVEGLLKNCSKSHGINYSTLRYFNVAGAHESGSIGESHDPETHLIPNVLKVALGLAKKDFLTIFGNDYNTFDGTCIRDYIHVTDLANAHILALKKIYDTNSNCIYNLGNGKGYSNLEIWKTAEKVTGRKIKMEFDQRREGDPAILVASSEKIKLELGWSPKFSSLEKIIETAWNWHYNNPNGF